MIATPRILFGLKSFESPWKTDRLIREDLFSIERLEQHAASLAEAQVVATNAPVRRSINARVRQNETVLLRAYRAIAIAVSEPHDITPAAEWLIDNYHVVEEQMRQIQDDLPPRYYRQLPKLSSGPLSGYPRVLGLAWAYVAHTDSRFDPDTLRRFVRAYQHVQPLTIGELWAVAITLRIILVENLRRAAERILSSRIARQNADHVADQLLGDNGLTADPQALIRRYNDGNELPASFIVQVVKRLRDQDPRVTPALTWLEKGLTERGTNSDEIVRDEHQRQGASNVTVRNIITSMRLISDVNWQDFFEDASLVDTVLSTAGNFADMDFATRNLYRGAIEDLARGTEQTELQIAQAVVAVAGAHARAAGSQSSRQSDPGYHLLDRGRPGFERSVGYRAPAGKWLSRFTASVGPGGYISALLLVTAVALAWPVWILAGKGIEQWQSALLALLGAIPAMDVAVALVNRAVTRGVSATMLPGMALREGVPPDLRTLVVVPTLLTTPAAIEEQIERLEVHYLATSPGAVHFALLSDWIDAATESTDEDHDLLAIASAGIARLNRTYGPVAGGKRFYLFHRRRLWSTGQRQWIGWERKRGKLHELNQLLRGATDTSFIGNGQQPPPAPAAVRYVITLDADTRLPRETVRRLIGKLAHPLNQPRFDALSGRVIEGYAVLQPRVTASLPVGREGSLFQRVFSSMSGIDAYGAAVSDVYQDLFGEGSYAGKGIYEVDAFEAALANRVPEGSLLSHDLFEGTFARSGLASDIEVVEEYPGRYDVAAARHHRWARGDWQLLPWILGRRDAARDGLREGGGHLPLIGRWKMLDNLRRTLSAPSCVLALLIGWTLPMYAALLWTAFVFATIALPPLLPVFAAIVPSRRGIVPRSHLRAFSHDLIRALMQIALGITFLAHQAWLMADAIVRTLFRLIVIRRNLLEWVTAAQTQLSFDLSTAGFYRRMSGSIVIALITLLEITWFRFDAGWIAAPIALLWLCAPELARRVSVSPPDARRLYVSAANADALRLVARRTWRFFETFVTPADNMLPPDNFQEDPLPVLAHRTSPTNLGLYLLCVVSARDFGWAGTKEVVERLRVTLATMGRLQRFRGHFYNWYDTRDLRPLEPRYVSAVDSGNLAAHLITLANACREWIGIPSTSAAFIGGIEDALRLTREASQSLPTDKRTLTTTRQQLDATVDAVSKSLQAASAGAANAISQITTSFPELVLHVTTLVDETRALANEQDDEAHGDLLFWAEATRNSIANWHRELTQTDTERQAWDKQLAEIETTARAMAVAMEFGFLLDADRKLLAIGYRAADGTLDPSCYDLLASEARLASFFAIAKNDVPARHWFRLGRAVTPIGLGAALISWSGSMFEYLMPSLVMRAPDGSLLEQTSRLIVRRQIAYGAMLGVPWGVSESAYYARDLELTYQYSNFGVPGLGLKRGLSENVVIAPYATGLAAMVDPKSAADNFARLTELGAQGRYGYYEALDYTRSRLPEGADFAIVRAFMAHHQGMTVVAIANLLFDGRMRARFHAEAGVQATELLLQERTPRDVSVAHPRAEEVGRASRMNDIALPDLRRVQGTHSATPQTHVLSNGRYAVMLTSTGSGYSRWAELAITRWREDATRDDAGSYIFLRDVETGAVWSAGFQPSGVQPDSYEVTYAEDRAEFVRSDGTLSTTLQVVVSPEDDAEVRRVSLTNAGAGDRYIDVTSYSELVLAPPGADLAHQAFSKLFVQTEFLSKLGVLLATRRPRSPGEPEVWAAHHVIVEGEVSTELEFETDRARFLGRGREIHEPIAIMDGRRLGNSAGTVLDPIFSLRRRVRIAAGATVRLAFWTAVAPSRVGVLGLVDKHHDANAFVRAATLAWTQAQVQPRHIGMTPSEANLFQRIAGFVLYADPSMRPSSDAIQRGSGSQPGLWPQGISGDLPIVLLRIDDLSDISIVRQLLRAHEYWRLKQLAVDLVIVNERGSSYFQELQVALETAVRTSQTGPHLGATSSTTSAGSGRNAGSVYLLRAELIPFETRALLSAAARLVFVARRGTLAEQIDRQTELPVAYPPATEAIVDAAPQARVGVPGDLEYFNGLGGFADNGREYVIRLEPGQVTPAPWVNVIANSQFGFQVAVEGGGYTWSLNSRENQLTPWSNDPVTDRPGEVFYVRDEDSGELWGPTVAPIRDQSAPYSARHGHGYSRFEHNARGIELELLVHVPLADPIKISRLKLHNASQRRRRLSVTAYIEWVLGTSRGASAQFIATEMDPQTGAMFARNPWNATLGARVAFADLRGQHTQWTADRREFLGRNGRLDRPAALITDAPLSGRGGAGLDPCCAMQVTLTLEPGETLEVVFFLGETGSAGDARSLLLRYRSADLDAVLRSVNDYWDQVLGTIQVKTPDRSMDLMLNRWLVYQVLACRTWARSAFYQASGAYGFRDQLQDGMALSVAQPAITREHLLRAAGRQFPEGDMQHWWLPVTGQGVRTRISDDRIWLGYTAAHYLKITGDVSILDEQLPFIEGPRLLPGEHDAYFMPSISEDRATLYEHCARGLDASLARGAHGLPLMGAGDWNDGMNRVGEKGQGESVWLGWFLHATLTAFASIAQSRGDKARAKRWLAHAEALREALERECWDGQWYRRAYFDDGTPLGSISNDECRIDSIAQSWSVISGVADPARAAQAMQAVDEQLIRREDGLALLFTPPFDQTPLDPGYIKGYPPGLRENGGQYTHAAAWCVIAFAKLGQGDKAAELFSLLNPINRTSTRTGLRRYKVEPYVVAADVYSVPPWVGRGGWTWYTGAAGWLYRAALESILGFNKRGNELTLTPCIPKSWPGFEMAFRHHTANYQIVVENPHAVSSGVVQITLDGALLPPGTTEISLQDDGASHRVQVRLGP